MNETSNRIQDVIHTNKKLILVFEFVEQDLKKFFTNRDSKLLEPILVKVCILYLINCQYNH